MYPMINSVLCLLAVVIVSARCSVESIPAISKSSGFAVPHTTQADEHHKRKLRTSDEAPHEERETFPIESFISSVKAADESLPGTIHAVNMVDMPQIKESNKALAIHKASMMDVTQIKERNIALATRMETLGIDIDGVVLVTKALKSAFPDFSLNNIEWMVLEKVYFERDGSNTGYKILYSKELFKELNMEITNYEEIKKWTARLNSFRVEAKMVFGKMLWLIQNRNELNLDLADVAKMAFGYEYLNRRKLPSSNQILDAVGEQNVDKHLVESILRHYQDSRKLWKRKAPTTADQRFAIESLTSSVKTADESLPRTKDAATMMDVSEIKERNRVLATRMETLGIDIDSVVLVAEALNSKLERFFSLNNLEWMVLGKVYFERDGSSTGYKILRSKNLFKELNMEIINYEEIVFKELNMEIINYEEIKKWTARIMGLKVRAENVFGKMLWLIQNRDELNLDLADAAKMAFGYEYLKIKKLPTSDEILQAVTEHTVDKDLLESVLRQDNNIRKRKAPITDRRFAIESLTSSVKTADESLSRTKHEATMMDVSEIKERNRVLATRLEKLGIDIGGVVYVTGALESEFGRSFSRNNLEWMLLGKLFFEKDESSTGYKILRSNKLFKDLNMEITNHEGIKTWIARLVGFHVGAQKVFGKMLWLLQHHNELNLDLADAAKMAFGSEYLETRELPFSNEVLEALTEHNVDKDVTESLIPQDKDSTMTDIAVDKLLKTTSDYVGEEVHEQSNKKRKLA